MSLKFTFWIALIFTIFTSLVISVLFTVRREKPLYLKLFPLYHATSIFTELIVGRYFQAPNFTYTVSSNIPYNVFTLIEFLFFSSVIFSVVQSGHKVIILSILVFLSIFFVLTFSFTLDFPTRGAVLIENLCLIIICFVYFNDIFSSFAIPDLSKEPSFWIVTGIMFYAVITTPFLIISGRKSLEDFFHVLYLPSNSVAYILMYLLFIKAYTCKTAN